MIKYKKETKEIDIFVSATCDKCKKEFTDDMEIQEFLHIRDTGGYGSIFGDGENINFDICQYCLYGWLGEEERNEENI